MSKTTITTATFHTTGYRAVTFKITERNGQAHFDLSADQLSQDCTAHHLAGLFMEFLKEKLGATVEEVKQTSIHN